MENLTTESFRSKVFDFQTKTDWSYQGDLPAIVDFYADWCGPCKRLTPVLEELSKDYDGKLHIYKVDTEAEPELAALFGVMSIPSLLFIPKDAEPQMATGALPRDILQKAIKDVLKVDPPLILTP